MITGWYALGKWNREYNGEYNDECSEDVLHIILVNSTYCTIFGSKHIPWCTMIFIHPLMWMYNGCCSSCNEQRDMTNSTFMYNSAWSELLILQWTMMPKEAKHSFRPCLDVCVSTSIHICWSGLEWNLVQLHSNPFEHMWIEMSTCASKQGFQWELCEAHTE